MKKRVYVIYTGGTVGMTPTSEGYAPAPGYLAAQIQNMPELASDLMPEVDIREYDPLLDSANMTPADWHKIAGDIGANYKKYDGFIVLHGTDTMAYTASALTFILQGLRKPENLDRFADSVMRGAQRRAGEHYHRVDRRREFRHP